MSWRSAMRRTRQRPRNNIQNSEIWSGNNNNLGRVTQAPQDSEQIGMHVRVLRYHEIRLGNIEKQLAKLSRQLSSSAQHPTTTSVMKNTGKQSEKKETVNQLQGVLKNLAEEVASSNKMIKQFITGDKINYKEAELKDRISNIPTVTKEIDEKDTMEWKLAKSRLIRCGIRATDERIRDMVSTMKEEVDLVADIIDNHTVNLEETIEKAVKKTVVTEEKSESHSDEKESLEDVALSDSSEDNSEEETVDISTSSDIGYVPVHVVVKKKRGRPKKKKTNAK